MSVRSEKLVAPTSAADQMAAAITEAQPADAGLHEGANYSTNSVENPLHRTVVVSVRASLNDLCLQKNKSTWAPSSEAMRSILQQKVHFHAHIHALPLSPSPAPLPIQLVHTPHVAEGGVDTGALSCSWPQKYTALDGSADQQGDLKERGHGA